MGTTTKMTNNTSVPDAKFHKELIAGLDNGAVYGTVVYQLKSKFGEFAPVTAPATYGQLKAMEEVSSSKDPAFAHYLKEVPRVVAMGNRKRSTKEAQMEAKRKQFEVQKRRLEEDQQQMENQFSRTIDDEDSGADSDSSASEARTEQSHSTSGLSGYTEDLEGFRAPSSGVSYKPSEASESVASRREPVGLRSRSAPFVAQVPSFVHTGPAPAPSAAVLLPSGSSSGSSSASSSSSSAASSAAPSSGSSSSGSSSVASVGSAALRFCSAAAAPVAAQFAIGAVRSATGI